MTKILQLRHFISYQLRKLWRWCRNIRDGTQFQLQHNSSVLPFLVLEMRTPLYRNYSAVPRSLFDNKKINLKKAIESLNHIVLMPQKSFSFWRCVGAPVASRGYVEGLAIKQGRASTSIGGGLCQLANAIHWLALHSDLQITERHRHSLDIFPDDNRLIPFGTGATLLFNYKDLRLHNPTDRQYQFEFEVTETELVARLYCSKNIAYSYSVSEADACFEKRNENYYRKNTIVRDCFDESGTKTKHEILFHNDCRCQYEPKDIL